MKKGDEVALEIIKFSFKTMFNTTKDIIKFIYYKEYKLKKNYIPGILIPGFSLIEFYRLDILNVYSIGIIPFFYFVPRSIIKMKYFQIQNKKYNNIFKQSGIVNNGVTPMFTRKYIIEREEFKLNDLLYNLKEELKKILSIEYKKRKQHERFKLFFKNNLTLETWLSKKNMLEVLLCTNIENIYYHKNYKNIVVTCNSKKINYEKIYEDKNIIMKDRVKAVLDSLGLKFKIVKYEDNLFCYLIKIKTRTNISQFTNIKNEFAHRIQLNVNNINIYSENGMIVFKLSIEMKTISFVEEHKKLTKLSKFRIPIYIGKNEEGKDIVFDLLDYYHWLIAGSTGQGKSNLLNVILSCIFLNRNKIAKYYLLDPKKVELSRYKNLKNVVYKNTQADILNQLIELENEMTNRYKLFESKNILDIDEWNEKFPNEKIGYIVIVIDEIANLMLSEDKKRFHDIIQHLGQEARGAGFRILLVTQCANGDVIKSTIKINYINRICMQVDNWQSSKVILDDNIGATLKNPGEIYMKLNNTLDKIKVPLITKQEKEQIQNGIELINGKN